jgi:hypothetical protein
MIAAGISAPPSKELAQNGARREAVPDPDGGARRALCAFDGVEDAAGFGRVDDEGAFCRVACFP